MSDDWLEDFEEAPIEKAQDKELALLREVDRRIESSANEIVEGTMRAFDVPFDATACPEGWKELYGPEEAERRFRIAKAAQLPTASAPVALKLAHQMKSGIMAAKAKRNDGPKTMNVALVKMTAPLPNFPVIEVPPDED